MKSTKRLVYNLKRNSGTIAAVLAVAGVCYTAYRGVKDGMKLERADISSKPTAEKVATVLSECYPTIISAAVTSALILASDKKHRKIEAGLAATVASAVKTHNETNIPEGIPNNEKIMFCESVSGQCFESTFEDVLDAEYNLNRLFILRGYASIGDFWNLLEIKTGKDPDKLGWEAYIGEVHYGYQWVDFQHRKKEINGKTYYEINYPFPPTDDYLDDNVDY